MGKRKLKIDILALKRLFSFMKENKVDIAKFILYTCFFSYLLFTWQRAYSPV
jgi:hypothetical protein